MEEVGHIELASCRSHGQHDSVARRTHYHGNPLEGRRLLLAAGSWVPRRIHNGVARPDGTKIPVRVKIVPKRYTNHNELFCGEDGNPAAIGNRLTIFLHITGGLPESSTRISICLAIIW